MHWPYFGDLHTSIYKQNILKKKFHTLLCLRFWSGRFSQFAINPLPLPGMVRCGGKAFLNSANYGCSQMFITSDFDMFKWWQTSTDAYSVRIQRLLVCFHLLSIGVNSKLMHCWILFKRSYSHLCRRISWIQNKKLIDLMYVILSPSFGQLVAKFRWFDY